MVDIKEEILPNEDKWKTETEVIHDVQEHVHGAGTSDSISTNSAFI
jgi:hypothetical protein